MDSSHPSSDQPVISAEQARQGEIILRKRWQRLVFFGGLAASVVLVILARIFAGA